MSYLEDGIYLFIIVQRNETTDTTRGLVCKVMNTSIRIIVLYRFQTYCLYFTMGDHSMTYNKDIELINDNHRSLHTI